MGQVSFRPEDLRRLSKHQIEWIALQRSQDDGLHICEKCKAPSFTRFCRKCGQDCFGKECGNTKVCGRPAARDDMYCGFCGYEFPVYMEGIHSLAQLAAAHSSGKVTDADLDKLFPEMPEDEFKAAAAMFARNNAEDANMAEQMAFQSMSAKGEGNG